MEGQQIISETALDVVVVHAHYRFGQGWDLAISTRRNGGTFQDDPRRVYDYLTTDELQQVVCDEMSRLLG